MTENINFSQVGLADLHDSVVDSITFNFHEGCCELKVQLHETLKKDNNIDYDILIICFEDILNINFDGVSSYEYGGFEIMEIKNQKTGDCIEVSILLLDSGQAESLFWNIGIKCKNIALRKETSVKN
jgi:hypothetical protein